MKYVLRLGGVLCALLLFGCGTSSSEVRSDMNAWKGQTDKAVEGTFGFPQKTVDMQAGAKVYEYTFNKCTLSFQIDAAQTVSAVQTTGDVGDCPRKLPGGGTF
jgi:hypothetical protein